MRATKYIATLVLSATSILGAQRIAPATAANSDGSWPMLNGDYTSRRYSPLTQINQANVVTLAQAWTFDPAAIKSIPIMVDGVLYFSATDRAWAIDAGTGQQIWAFNRPSRGNKIANHGLAIYQDRV